MTALRRNLTLGGIGLVGFLGLFLGLLLPGAGCGGGSAAPDAGGAAGTGGLTTGPQGCTTLVTALCSRDMACNAPDAGASDLADCVRLQGIGIGCAQAPATTDFKSCVDDVRLVSCASLFPSTGPMAPGSCTAPLNAIPLSAAQQKCADLAGKACEKSAMCQGITPTPADLQSCQAGVYFNLGCPLATAAGATFDQCITDLGNSACTPADGGTTADGGSSLPSCDTAITFAM